MDQLEKIREVQKLFFKDRDWEQFHSPKNLSMALAAEAAELLEIFMWLKEEQTIDLAVKFPERFQNAKEEIADIFLYLLRISEVMNIDLFTAVEEKMKMNEQKYPIQKGLELTKALNNS